MSKIADRIEGNKREREREEQFVVCCECVDAARVRQYSSNKWLLPGCNSSRAQWTSERQWSDKLAAFQLSSLQSSSPFTGQQRWWTTTTTTLKLKMARAWISLARSIAFSANFGLADEWAVFAVTSAVNCSVGTWICGEPFFDSKLRLNVEVDGAEKESGKESN